MKLFDLHCDTATECEKNGFSLLSNTFDWDFERAVTMFSSSYQITAVYVPDTISDSDAWSYTSRVFSFIKQHPIPILRLTTDFNSHSHGILLAVENGKAIGDDISRISALANAGVVYVTLTWNGSNLIGNGALSGKHEGLSAFGKSVLAEMHRVGIIPDVSHLNEAGFWDVITHSQGYPVIASHSNSYIVCPHPRNLKDEQFHALKESGGIVGLNLCDAHLGIHSFEQLERHLYHYLSLGGESVVAFGMDLDGTPIPKEWNGVEVALRLYDWFLSRQYSESILYKLFFENSHSFFTKTLTLREKCIRIGS